MFRLFWICIVVCLLASVIFLGTNIFKRSSQMESDPAGKRIHVVEKAPGLKADAMMLKQGLQKVHKKINDSLDKISVNLKRDQPDKGANGKPGKPSTKDGTSKPPVALKPLDEEDRQLTAEVMGVHVRTEEKAAQPEDKEPMDPDRLNKIRDLYAKTMEILDFN